MRNGMQNQFNKVMKAEGLDEALIRTFGSYYDSFAAGEKGIISASEVRPPSADNLVDYNQIKDYARTDILKKVVVIKLNGGLGTSMGLSQAKSLLPVKGNMNFLDIISRQVLTLRAQSGYDVLLLLMNSYVTQEDTLKYLSKYPDLSKQDIPISFVQNKFPRIRQDDLQPYESADKDKCWNPPGHGDLFASIAKDHLLDRLIDQGYRYAFVSNSDNLGATVDTAIPAYMEKQDLSFLMEVCDRSVNDKKGGHLCEDKSGQLMLREIAQCPPEDLEQFQDISYYRYFNTNNLWIDLKALQWQLISGDGVMLLPLIVNPKVVDGTPVFQLETAMGSAISVFSKSKALVVPRSRFAPVKKTSDLLAIWSDLYELNDQYQIVLKRNVTAVPKLELDEVYYGKIEQLKARFAKGVPSLVACSELKLEGDISFEDEVVCEGKVQVKAGTPSVIKKGVISGQINL